MPCRFTARLVKYPACLLTFCLWTSFSIAQPNVHYNGEEDTILIEKEVSQKIPYHRILKSISKRLFKIDMNSMLTIGKTRRDVIARNFRDYADRVKYRLKVDRNEVGVKLSLNF